MKALCQDGNLQYELKIHCKVTGFFFTKKSTVVFINWTTNRTNIGNKK